MFSVFTILKIRGESSRVITVRNCAAAAVAHACALASAEANGLRCPDEHQYDVPPSQALARLQDAECRP